VRRADAHILDIIFYHMTDRDFEILLGWMSGGAVGRFSDYFAACRRPRPDDPMQPVKH
jgi:hypothetical protein